MKAELKLSEAEIKEAILAYVKSGGWEATDVQLSCSGGSGYGDVERFAATVKVTNVSNRGG